MKRITSACLEQTLIFDSQQELDAFRKKMKAKGVPFQVERVDMLEDGMVSVRAKRRYIHYPVGEYMNRGDAV